MRNTISGLRARLRPLHAKEIVMVSTGAIGIALIVVGVYAENSITLVSGAAVTAGSFIVTAYYLLHRHDGDEDDVG